jgi:hypothetical protein
MRKIVSLVVILVVNISVYGQTPHDPQWDNVTIYDYGEQAVTSCESNFENLSRNWNKWITNHKETELVSYSYVETLKDSDRITYYSNIMCGWESTGANHSSSSNSTGNADTTTYTREFHIVPTTFKEQLEKFSEASTDTVKLSLFKAKIDGMLKIMKNQFMERVNIGDKVYLIKLKAKGKIYDHYVICRPNENKIVSYDFLLNIYDTRANLQKWLKQ